MIDTNKKIILFDFDGVIVDSFETAFKVNRIVRFKLNHTRDDFRKYFEGNLFERCSKMDKDEKISAVLFSKFYIPKLLRLPAIKGIVAVLRTLNKQYKLIIISSTISAPIREWLNKHNLMHYFTEIMGADVHKSKVEKIKMVFKKYKVGAEQCVFITDTLGDLLEAKEAKIKSFAVLYGFHDEKTLRKGNPIDLIKNPKDILFKVQNYWEKQ